MTRTALIIGITGNFGAAVAAALAARGWRIRALHRNPAQAAARVSGQVEWIQGDGLDRAAVVAAAAGVQVIVHAANPPRYRHWRRLALPMLENAVAAARAADARLLLPGNVYNYGPDAWSGIREDSPQHPTTRKGRIRVEMEALLRQAPRSLVLRAGDFFGGRGDSGWFESVLAKTPLKAITYPGEAGVGHAWAYLPDLAEVAARLLEREDALATHDSFNFGGHWLPRGEIMVEAIRRAAGRPELPARRLPWAALYLAAPFNATLRELIEMRYLWRESVKLEDGKLRGFLGELPHTPLETAVGEALSAM